MSVAECSAVVGSKSAMTVSYTWRRSSAGSLKMPRGSPVVVFCAMLYLLVFDGIAKNKEMKTGVAVDVYRTIMNQSAFVTIDTLASDSDCSV